MKDDAERLLCGWNTAVSTPLRNMVSLTHRARISFVAACAFPCVTKKAFSVEGTKAFRISRYDKSQRKAVVTFVKTAGESCHSVFSLKFLDLKSTTTFSHPAMWSAESQISLSFAQSHRSLATKLQAKECAPPPLLTYDTAVILSSISFICQHDKSFPKDCKTNFAANNSSMLICAGDSLSDHRPQCRRLYQCLPSSLS